jgi:hypothetical protein
MKVITTAIIFLIVLGFSLSVFAEHEKHLTPEQKHELQELYDTTQMVYFTEVGEIVLMAKGCEITKELDDKYKGLFRYAVYATDIDKVHEGCWYADSETVYTHFPELGDLVLTYKHEQFNNRKELTEL